MSEKWKQEIKKLSQQGLKDTAILNKLKDKYTFLTRGKVRYQLEIMNKTKYVKEAPDLSPSYTEVKKEWDGTQTITFGLISDTHFGSKKTTINTS